MASFAFYLAVISSMLSQTPAFLESGVDQYLKLTWVLPLVVLIFDNPRAFINRKLFFFYSFVLFFFLYCLILQSLKDVEYMGADLYNIAISLMVTIVSLPTGLNMEVLQILNFWLFFFCFQHYTLQ